MKEILDLYMRNNGNSINRTLDEYGNTVSIIPNLMLVLGITYYGKNYSRIYLHENKIYDEYHCSFIFKQYIYVNDLCK